MGRGFLIGDVVRRLGQEGRRSIFPDDEVTVTDASVEGQAVTFDTTAGVKVDGANVIGADIIASNGVIHVIDTVIMPN